MDTYDKILAVLDHNLDTTDNLPNVVFENTRPVEQPYGSEFIWTQFSPVERFPSARGPDPLMRYSGLYFINVCTPQNEGTKRSRDIVTSVLSTFKGASHASLNDFHVTIESSRQEAGFKMENHFCVPVVVDWYCFAT